MTEKRSIETSIMMQMEKGLKIDMEEGANKETEKELEKIDKWREHM